ncbi:YggS family pyridoxal phosphate-dependent enzyme [Eisenbergiella sp.]
MIKENLDRVQENIRNACARAGRKDDEVTLIAVSKTKPVSMLEEAYALGVRDFGENKVQELVDKAGQLPKDIRWHMIGHLQRNKVKYIIDKAYLIHSVDSLRLAEEISKEAVKHGVTVNILIEVNVAGEESKFGVSPEDTPVLIEEISRLPAIQVRGLMTIAPFVEKAEDNRIIFNALLKLYVDISRKNIDNVHMDFLSMGMTGDYEVAVEEGATFVRVGTGIFGERSYRITE